MAKQITKPARGDAKNTGTPVTGAPTKKWAPSTNVKQFVPGYGTNLDPGPSSVEGARTSSLADELRRVAEAGDQGPHLSTLIEKGSAKDSMVDLRSPQTRAYTDEQKVPTTFGMKSQTAKSAKPGDVVIGELPKTLGASAAQPIRKPQ